MNRIQELLAKGIDKLSAEELAELQTLCNEEADKLLDEAGDAPSDEQISALETIAAALEQATAQEAALEQQKAERAAKVAELAKRIKGGDAPADDNDDTVDDDAVDEEDKELEPAGASILDEIVDAEVEDLTVEPTLVVTGNAVTTIASGTISTEIGRPGAVVTRVAARRPASTVAKPAATEAPPVLTASANLPGIRYGEKLTDDRKMYNAWDSAVQTALSAGLGGGQNPFIKIPVCGMRTEWPDDLLLDDDSRRNRAKIDARSSRTALAASGGICLPVPLKYDINVISNEALPVHAGLNRFGAMRGGVKTLEPPDLQDFATSTYVKKWTMTNDENPTSPTTKPVFTIPCNNTERSTMVYAVPITVKIGNFRQKWAPEIVKSYMDIVNTAVARQREAWFIDAIGDGSTNITHGQVLGSARDVMHSLRQLFATQRYRLRAPDSFRMHCIAPAWLRDMMLVDLQRIGTDGGTAEERLRAAESTLDSFFTAVKTNVTWHIDYRDGVALGTPGGPLAGVQGAGPVIGWPSKVQVLVYPEGSWLYLDGGTWDFGVIRDSTLIGTNDFLMFSEVAENVHYDGPVGETFAYDIDICSNGLTVAGADITVCTSGS